MKHRDRILTKSLVSHILFTAQAAGDPHLVTLDGKGYSFNGVGDFILVQDLNSSVIIQVRAEQATDKNGMLFYDLPIV